MSTVKNQEQIQDEIRNTRARMDQTLEAIEHQLSPGELLDKSIDYLKAPGGYVSEFSGNLGEKVKENPLPLALIGLGLGWLMMSDARSRETGAVRPTSSYPDSNDDRSGTFRARSAGDGPGIYRTVHHSSDTDQDSQGVGDRVQEGLRSAKDDTASAVDSGKEKLSDTAQAAKNRANEVADAATRKISAAGEQLDETWQNTKHATSEAAAQARYRAERLHRQGKHRLGEAQRELGNLMQDQPLVLGALGALVGVAVGVSLPASRREDQLIGEYRDQLVDEVGEQGQAYKEKAQNVADAALKEGNREARAQGFNAGDGKEALAKMKDELKEKGAEFSEKMERVGSAAYGAAKREAEKQDLTRDSQSSSPDSASTGRS